MRFIAACAVACLAACGVSSPGPSGSAGAPPPAAPDGGSPGGGSGGPAQDGGVPQSAFHFLSVHINGQGTVTSEPGGIDCPDTCAASFAESTSVSLTAKPAAGFHFEGWGMGCSGAGPCIARVDADTDVFATFTADAPPPPPPPPPPVLAYTIQELPSVDGVSELFPAGIDNRGDVVGTYTTAPPPGVGPRRSFFYDASTRAARRILDDGTIHQTATGINDARQVSAETFDSTSRSSPGHTRGVRWQDGVETDIGALPPGPNGPHSSAKAINAQGFIAGWSLGPANFQRAVLWDGSTLHDLGSGSPDQAFSTALGINASGQVVGQTFFPGATRPDAALFENGTIRDLGSLDGGGGSIALAISDAGRIVGNTPVPNDRFQHAFVFDLPNGPMRDVSPGRPCDLVAVNSGGVAVGGCVADVSGGPTRLRAAILRGAAMEDLDPILGDSHWVLESAVAINGKGQIAGVGLHDGKLRAFVLTPR